MKRDLNYFLLNKNNSIKDAMERLGALGIVLIVDEQKRLLGTITDGDIRRAILKKIDITESISKIINTNPLTVHLDISDRDLLALMISKDKKQIPIVDSENRVVALKSIESLLVKDRKENIAFILAGGKGSRLYPLTKQTPKPMLKVSKKPILETIVQQLSFYGFKNIVISIFYNGDAIREHFGDGTDFGVKITYTCESHPLGTAGPLSLLETNTSLPILVINGDLLSKIDYNELLEWHESNKYDLTVGYRKMELKIPYGVLNMDRDCVTSLAEKPTNTYCVNAGIYILDHQLIQSIPKEKFYNMTDLINDTISKNQRVGGYQINDYWLDIGTHENYERAKQEFSQIFQS